MASAPTTVDPTKIKPVPLPKTLVLVNNFVINTCNFLNGFSEACEQKISAISSKVTELEILLAVLEAKLNSIPDLDVPVSKPAMSAAPDNLPSVPDAAAAPPVPVTSSTAAPAPAPAPAPVPAPVPAPAPPAAVAADVLLAKDHPDYAPFFKMLRVGVPMPVVCAKAAAAGLDPSMLENPEAPMSLSGSPGGGSGGGGGGGGGPKPLSRIIFDKFDRDKSGDISVDELQSMAMEFGVWLSGDTLKVAMRTLDANGDGRITYEEFVSWYKSSPSFSSLALDDVTLKRRQALAGVFAKYDSDKNGVLSRSEFAGLHREMTSLGLTRKTLDQALEDMDTNSDGVIQFGELVAWADRT